MDDAASMVCIFFIGGLEIIKLILIEVFSSSKALKTK